MGKELINIMREQQTTQDQEQDIMNEGDIASKYVEHHIKTALDKRVKFEGKSLEECVLCGNDIPPKRQALGGVTKCIDCQSRSEGKNKHYR